MEYRGGVAQLGWFVRGELGRAVGALEQMGDALESYMQLGERRGGTPEQPAADEGGSP